MSKHSLQSPVHMPCDQETQGFVAGDGSKSLEMLKNVEFALVSHELGTETRGGATCKIKSSRTGKEDTVELQTVAGGSDGSISESHKVTSEEGHRSAVIAASKRALDGNVLDTNETATNGTESSSTAHSSGTPHGPVVLHKSDSCNRFDETKPPLDLTASSFMSRDSPTSLSSKSSYTSNLAVSSDKIKAEEPSSDQTESPLRIHENGTPETSHQTSTAEPETGDDGGPKAVNGPATLIDSLKGADEYGLQTQDVPTDVASIRAFSFDPVNKKKPMVQVISTFIVEMINHKKTLTQDELQRVFNILTCIASLKTVTAEMDKALGITWILRSIRGECPKAKGPYTFPEAFEQDATLILATVEEKLASEASIEAAQAEAESGTDPLSQAQKRRRTTSNSQSPIVVDIDGGKLREALRGIMITDGNRRTYKMDPNANPRPRNCNVVGHNGLTIGQWWPLRICAIRDGAHGASMGGIAGGTNTGAFSIVVAAGYQDLDEDHGEVLFYSGSNSHTNEDPTNPIVTYATRAMQRSKADRRPIRVIRGGAGTGRFSPAMGLRYDGLYSIVGEQIRKNSRGGAYLRFKLVRDTDQSKIDLTRPNTRERRIFEMLKEL